MEVIEISPSEANDVISRSEGHFVDFKSKRIAPAKLSRTVAALANAEGGEVYIGIEDADTAGDRWDGFSVEEDANSTLAVLHDLFPQGESFSYRFLRSSGRKGLILACEIFKNQYVWKDSQGDIYLRKGAQSLRQDTFEKQERLRLNKGISSFEDSKVDIDEGELSESNTFALFSSTIVPQAEPVSWLRKQKIVRDGKATVAGIVLFDDEPQAVLPKAAIKVSRYRTSDEPTRATLEGLPATIEGPVVTLIKSAVDKIVEIVEKIPVMKDSGLKAVQYPRDAIHEIITNAVIHRDYSINDDVHVRIFDNRIEIYSPGPLPAHVTVSNILDERFARNQKIVRLANKFPDAPNKDVGEGLNTAFEAMRELQLKDPIVSQTGAGVLVTLRHEKLAEPEQAIINFLKNNDEINNSGARAITYIGSENKVKNIFRKMMDAQIIERIPGRSQAKTGYRKGSKFPLD
ncbi:ATP-dependent DNA helicase RecG [Sphingomonas koreensis]|uniref:ATP-binding protein n=1 Tax=Sphingomonas koreensis TaxID=93064 RepID=UPI0009FD1722|nr:ATP-binding protein [Sphingomonas koreensis]PJI88544.1 ATP-dependent DNA helicase RecG [Sphingomonas koreensis]RSU58865.1 ATP-dependent DNA helicase RecG [Sphingomonas koreensis]RSU67231.1 ATP-dependent DNA helicase RecG [Sphingomonas koreensis]